MPAPEYFSLRMAAAQTSPISSCSSSGTVGAVSLFPHLLVAALQRAVAGAEVNGIALAIAQHLHLDVARLAEVLFHVDRLVAEGGLGLGAGGRPGE